MKRNILTFIILIISIIGLKAQNAPSNKQDSIIFNKLMHDYGTIERGGDGECEFVFTNKGDAPLVLNNVRASCGCTVPKWPREPIPPGEKGVIKVQYSTRITGAFNKSITVNSNASNSTVRLTIKGQVTK